MLKVLRTCFLMQHWDFCEQDVHVVSRLKSRWPTYPWLSLLWCSHGGRSGAQIRCWSSSPWRASSWRGDALGMYRVPIVMELGSLCGENVTDMDDPFCRQNTGD